ncbi:hypothetical protein OS176_08440 [Xanthomonadaceae bacterium XH05]|nr:hypothetical protein [Xanthomonadaceae bacterium XH05]
MPSTVCRVARVPLALAAVLAAAAAPASPDTIPRHVIASGGGSASGGAYAVTGSIGQADADPLHPASGGVYALTGGFWFVQLTTGPEPGPGCGSDTDCIFANGFE